MSNVAKQTGNHTLLPNGKAQGTLNDPDSSHNSTISTGIGPPKASTTTVTKPATNGTTPPTPLVPGFSVGLTYNGMPWPGVPWFGSVMPFYHLPSTTASARPNVPIAATEPDTSALTTRKRRRTDDDSEREKAVKSRMALLLANDCKQTSNPSIEAPFTDAKDVVRRLLPFHIYQHPENELRYAQSSKAHARYRTAEKGKEKETSSPSNQEEEDGLASFRRKKDELEAKFQKLKIRDAEYSSPRDQIFWLTQATYEADRELNSQMNTQLRDARAENERKEREKRVGSTSTSSAPRATPSQSTTMPKATAAPHPMAYAAQTPYANAYAQYYQSYAAMMASKGYNAAGVSSPFATSYAYANYINAHASSLAAAIPQTFTPSVVPSASLPSNQGTPASTVSSLSSDAATIQESPFAVSIPSSALSGLHSIGIYPLPVTSIPPPPSPQPAAILLGMADEGKILNLSIYLSRLDKTQMAGLSVLLRSLVPSNPGTNSTSASTSKPVVT